MVKLQGIVEIGKGIGIPIGIPIGSTPPRKRKNINIILSLRTPPPFSLI